MQCNQMKRCSCEELNIQKHAENQVQDLLMFDTCCPKSMPSPNWLHADVAGDRFIMLIHPPSLLVPRKQAFYEMMDAITTAGLSPDHRTDQRMDHMEANGFGVWV